MNAFTRRSFLSQVPAAVAVGAVPTVVMVSVEPRTPERRIEAAMKEIESALQERYPGFKLQARFDTQRPIIRDREGDVNRAAVLVYAYRDICGPEEARWFVNHL